MLFSTSNAGLANVDSESPGSNKIMDQCVVAEIVEIESGGGGAGWQADWN